MATGVSMASVSDWPASAFFSGWLQESIATDKMNMTNRLNGDFIRMLFGITIKINKVSLLMCSIISI